VSAPVSPQDCTFLGYAVFGLDRWLRQRQGVFEYTSNPTCLFRVARAEAELDIALSDGTHVYPGVPILNLHLWNEHVPPMTKYGATIQWARQMSRAMDWSLRELAGYLARSRDLCDVVAIRADMRVATRERRKKLASIAEHFGFEPVPAAHSNWLHSFGENILMFFLVSVVNRPALRSDILRRDHTLFYYSRKALERRYRINMGPHMEGFT
jgi:hypothetical protein